MTVSGGGLGTVLQPARAITNNKAIPPHFDTILIVRKRVAETRVFGPFEDVITLTSNCGLQTGLRDVYSGGIIGI
jgi:hypothetical protein